MKPIYLDYAATTPVDPRVIEKMLLCLGPEAIFANPASVHVFGQMAKKVVDDAREQIADVIHAEASEIIFTGGATEANNLALKGAAHLYQAKGKHIVTLKTEHVSVLDCCQQLEKQGFFITYLTPETNGQLKIETLKAALRPDTILVSVMQVNNEIGVIQDIQAIADLTQERDILLHVDAAQSIGKVEVDLRKTPVNLMSFCAHKAYGPKGIGALFVRRKPRVRVAAQIHGGGQEQGMRSGTLAPHQIVGMAEAFALAQSSLQTECKRIIAMKQFFYQALREETQMQGEMTQTVPHILNLVFPGITAQSLMAGLPELAVSTGSACHARGIEPSHVLRALGLSKSQAQSALRFSFGRFTTQLEIESAVQRIKDFLAREKPR